MHSPPTPPSPGGSRRSRVGLGASLSGLLLAAVGTPLHAQSSFGGPAAAGATADGLDQVVVTATRSPQAIANTLSDVTVIDAATIAQSGAASLPELLQSVGGMEISENGGTGKVSGIFLRGTSTAQSIVLVDGLRLENPLSGGGNLEFMPLSAIDRIEIVRGPSSAFYGSGAIGGVIQIFTKQGEGPVRPTVSVGYGSRDTSQLRAGVSGSAGDQGATRYALTVGSDRTRGFDATTPDSPNFQPDRDGNRQWSVTGSLSHRFNAAWEAGANLLSTEGRTQYDDAFSTPATAVTHFSQRAFGGFVRGDVMPVWHTELRLGATQIDYRYDAFTFAPHLQSNTLFWQNTFRLPLGRLLAGYEQLNQTIKGDGLTAQTDSVYLRDSRTTRSFHAGYELDRGAQLFRAQLRHDQIDTVGAETTGSVAYGYRLDPHWLLRGSYGTAFRAPTFDDLYNPFGSNPDLKPERSRGLEVALERREGAQFFKATAFASRIRDAIALDGNFVPQNLQEAKVTGVTFEARQALSESWTLRGNLTLQRADGTQMDASTGVQTESRLARRARRFGMVALDWHQGNWRSSVQWIASGDRVDTAGEPLGGYGLLNVGAGYRFAPGWDVYASLSNLADRNYQTAFGYNSPPRTVFVTLRYAPS